MADPTHNIAIKRKTGSAPYKQVGVAWLDSTKGFFTLVLDDGVTLDWRMTETHYINMFPRKERTQVPPGPAWDPPIPSRVSGSGDDPIPF